MKNHILWWISLGILIVGANIENRTIIVLGSLVFLYSCLTFVVYTSKDKFKNINVDVIKVTEAGLDKYYLKRRVIVLGKMFSAYLYMNHKGEWESTSSIENVSGMDNINTAISLANGALNYFSSKTRLGVEIVYSTTSKKDMLSLPPIRDFDKKNELFLKLLEKDASGENTDALFSELKLLHAKSKN